MARAADTDERIGLLVESRADVSGFRTAREQNSALAREAKAAAAEMAQGAQHGARAQQTLASAAQEAMVAQDKLTLSGEQGRRLWQQAGGDYQQFLRLLREHVEEQKAVTAAIQQTAEAQQQLQDQQAKPVQLPPGGKPEDVSKELDRIPGKARTAANSISMLAFAMANGGTNARSLAVAAGSAADSISVLSGSARIAAGAAGIGALVVIITSAIALLDKLGEKARTVNLAGNLGSMTDEAFAARERQMAERIERQQARASVAAEMARRHSVLDPIGGVMLHIEARREQKILEDMLQQQGELRQEGLDRQQQQARAAAEQRRQIEEEALQRAHELNQGLTESHLDAQAQITMSAADAAIARVNRQKEALLREIEDLAIAEEEKKNLRIAAETEAASQIQLIRKREADREKKEEDRKNKEIEEATERAWQKRAQIIESALQTSISAGESLGRALTRMALTPIVRELEGIAASQLVKAARSAASFDIIGAARHAGVATLATAVARQVASWGGLTGSGSSGAAGSGPALLSRDPREAGSDVTVIVQTVDPTSREVLGQTAWYLDRSGILKTPTNVPVTTIGPSLRGVYAS